MKKTILFLILICFSTSISLCQDKKTAETDSLTATSLEKDSMSILTVRRPKQSQSILRKVNIFVDGKKIGKIADGETKSFKILPGFHKITAQIDWCKSPALSFHVLADSTKTFSLNFNKSNLVAAYQALFDWKKYVTLTELK